MGGFKDPWQGRLLGPRGGFWDPGVAFGTQGWQVERMVAYNGNKIGFELLILSDKM